MLKYLILSNDSKVISRIETEIIEFSDFVCLDTTCDYDKACNTILKEKPDLIFIDLDMGNSANSSFEFTNHLFHYTDNLPNFVAISANKELAYLTIKNDFSDYLLKPINEFEFRRCILKFKKKNKRKINRICLKNNADYQYLVLNEILYLKADNNTTDIILITGNKITAFETLKKFQRKLPVQFLRIHNSYIINTYQIRKISFSKSKIYLTSADNVVNIPFSRKYKNFVKDFNRQLIDAEFSNLLN
ncbi:LytR/AlgR family response regulator transcription factor [Zunongwangia sp.]|uniref:LytR/AlgR family response regulator transcription factor n=1 Tax=Zunongwangia sp. TaxID=1965325 RepID=UPI003AA84840